MFDILFRLLRSPAVLVFVFSLAIMWMLPDEIEIMQQIHAISEGTSSQTPSISPVQVSDEVITGEEEDSFLLPETRYSILMNPRNFHQRPDYSEVMMTDSSGAQYLCYVPPASTNQGKRNQTHVPTIAEVLKVLDPLRQSCLYRVEGWWTYEYCHLRHLRQFHEDKASKISYILGKWDAQLTAPPPSKITPPNRAAEVPATFVQTYAEGTVCDLTNQERETTVQFRCSRDTQTLLSMVKEPSSCHYVVVVHTPVLCSLSYFSMADDVVQPIACSKV